MRRRQIHMTTGPRVEPAGSQGTGTRDAKTSTLSSSTSVARRSWPRPNSASRAGRCMHASSPSTVWPWPSARLSQVLAPPAVCGCTPSLCSCCRVSALCPGSFGACSAHSWRALVATWYGGEATPTPTLRLSFSSFRWPQHVVLLQHSGASRSTRSKRRP